MTTREASTPSAYIGRAARTLDTTRARTPSRELLDAGWTTPLELPELPEGDAVTRMKVVQESGFPVLAIPEEFGGLGGGKLARAPAPRPLGLIEPGLADGPFMHPHPVGGVGGDPRPGEGNPRVVARGDRG